jgi:hypothetical protein
MACRAKNLAMAATAWRRGSIAERSSAQWPRGSSLVGSVALRSPRPEFLRRTAVAFHSARRHLAAGSTVSPPPSAPAAETATGAAPADSDKAAASNERSARPNAFLGGAGARTDKSFGRALELLRSARRALDGESPAAALALFDRYAVEFPRGSALQPEYEATRVLALCAAGQTEAGERARDHFLLKQSASPLAERVRTACGSR